MERPTGGRARRQQSLLLSALVFAGTGGPWSPSWAAICDTSTESFIVEDSSGAHLLNDAVNCSDGGHLEVIWVGTVTLDAPIAIGNATFLSVTGADHQAEVQGVDSTRLFDVSEGGGLSLTQLTLSGGTAPNGGAIYAFNANLTLDGCVLDGNTASDGDGGAVWAEGGRIAIIGGEFQRNAATRNGGAVCVMKSDLTVQGGTRFVANIGKEGGALYTAQLSGSLDSVAFLANNATGRGGGWSHSLGDVKITAGTFTKNQAQVSGGGLFGGSDTFLTVDGCAFQDNVTPGSGGGIAAASAVIRGGTELSNNFADDNGGGIYAWDQTGRIDFEDSICTDNTAGEKGGCLFLTGNTSFTNGTVMRGNMGYMGGCVYADEDSIVNVNGGEFTCVATRNGGFLFAAEGSSLVMTSGLVANNTAGRRGAGVYCEGNNVELGGAQVWIKGGSFINNEALEAGGAIMAWGDLSVATVTGGYFQNNTARFYGGFVFLELQASLSCTGAMIRGNSAGDQGGGIYARDATWVNSSCDMIDNEAPQGAAAYLTYVANVTLENLDVAGNVLASGGSTCFLAASSVSAKEVSFASGVMLDEEVSYTTRAIQLDDQSTFVCDGCVFDGWLGDTVILNANADNGSLVLDNCDFRGSSAAMAVVSPYSDAEIRNAVVGDQTVVAADNQNPLKLVDRALECADPNACGGDGECVDSALGVLCKCLPKSDECLDDGGTMSLILTSPPNTVTYSPALVSFELQVSAAEGGTTYNMWELAFEADDLILTAVPSSGILPPGANATVTITGALPEDCVGGVLTSHFVLTSFGSGGGGTLDSPTTGGVVELDVESTFYLCRAFQYASPIEYDDGEASFECKQCVGIDGSEGVDCDNAGAAVTSLPIREGYWRSGAESIVIYPCIHSKACTGGTEVSSSDDYCADGYRGPYCAVCAGGYGSGVGSTCHSCKKSASSQALIAAGVFFFVVALCVAFLTVAVLVGGLGAVGTACRMALASWSYSNGKTCKDWSNASHDRVDATQKSEPDTSTVALASNVTATGIGESGTSGHYSHFAPQTAGSEPPLEPAEEKHSREGSSDVLSEEAKNVDRFDTPKPSRDGFAGMAFGYRTPCSALASTQHVDAAMFANEEQTSDSGSGSEQQRGFCWNLNGKIKRCVSCLPWGKIKILVVVWQILTVFPTITAVEFPPVYAQFLSWINVVNFDLGLLISASCILPSVQFYQRLLVTTLAPIVLVGVLTITHHMAKRLSGIGSRGEIARRAAWSRHMAAGLLLSFLVFTSASTIVFKAFDCDAQVVGGESYLRADYSISCNDNTYKAFRVYAGIMVLVYPVGIPFLYFFILWTNRHSLNPRPRAVASGTKTPLESDVDCDRNTLGAREQAAKIPSHRNFTTLSLEAKCEIEEQVRLRMNNPSLVPSMFLWKDFGPELYYYEVVECGRRILLTGVLMSFPPYSAAQAAMACLFAFASLLGFELLRPHLDPADSWLYRLGCIIIFLSNFLALLIKVEAAGDESGYSRDALGGLLVALNVFLVVAVLFATWFSTQQQVDDSREEDNIVTMARTMASAERLETEARKTNRPKQWSLASGEVSSSAETCIGANVNFGSSTFEPAGSRLSPFSGLEERGGTWETVSSTSEGDDSVSCPIGRGVLLRQHGNNNILRDFPSA